MDHRLSNCKCDTEHNVDRWKCDDDSMGNDSAYLRYSAHMVKAMKSQGLNPNLTLSDYKHMLEEAGFVDIKTYEFKVDYTPTGSASDIRILNFLACCWKLAPKSESKKIGKNSGRDFANWF